MKTLLCLLLFIAHTFADVPKPLPATNPWDLAGLSRAPKVEWRDEDKPIRSLFYAGEPFEGKPTKVFAYYASPATLGIDKEAGKRFPAVVLVHGGGGNAFEKWAEIYAKRGYAAIAMDLAGCWKPAPDKKPERHADGGPDQSDGTKFKETPAPHHDQWTYHAVADVLLAHSLLLSLPEVDNNRTGVTGISWGGYLTCIVAGVDPRFKVAVPQYGCGFLQDNSAWSKQYFDPTKPEWSWRKQWVKLWDPSSYVGSATMPMLFINGSNDFAYPVDSYMKTYALVKSPKRICIIPAMPHGHIFDVVEVFRFIDSVLNTTERGKSFISVSRCEVSEGKLMVEVNSKLPLELAELHFTTAPHAENQKRVWTKQRLVISDKKITGEGPPTDATAWYVSIMDWAGTHISSEVTIH